MPSTRVSGIRSYVTRSDVQLSKKLTNMMRPAIASGFKVPHEIPDFPTEFAPSGGRDRDDVSEMEMIKSQLENAVKIIDENKTNINSTKTNIDNVKRVTDINTSSIQKTNNDIIDTRKIVTQNTNKLTELSSSIDQHSQKLSSYDVLLNTVDDEIKNIKQIANENFTIQGEAIETIAADLDKSKKEIASEIATEIASVKNILNDAIVSGSIASENKEDITSLSSLINQVEQRATQNTKEIATVSNDMNTLASSLTSVAQSAQEQAHSAIKSVENVSADVLSLANQASNASQSVSSLQLQMESSIMKQNILDSYVGDAVNMFTQISPVCSSVFMTFSTIGSIRGGTYMGSGCFITLNDSDLKYGLFLTCAHNVVRIAGTQVQYIREAYIENPINKEWFFINPDMIFVDGVGDIALFKTNIDFSNSSIKPLRLAQTQAKTGDTCFVIGDPAGMDSDSFVKGVVRSGNYEMKPISYQINECIYIDAATTGGNSGGPIVNTNGNIIGMLTYGSDGFSTFCGGPTAKSITSSLEVLSQFRHNKEKKYLGITWGVAYPMTLFAIKKSLNSELSPTTSGVQIYNIDSLSPFYGTLKTGDILLSIKTHDKNGNDIENFALGVHDDETPLGVLLYKYNIHSITPTYISRQTGKIQSKKILFTKTYANVEDIKDMYLSTGLRKEVEEPKI